MSDARAPGPPRPPISGGLLAFHAAAALALGGAVALFGWVAEARWLYAAAPLVAVLYLAAALRHPLEVRRALGTPLPETWRVLLERRVPYYRQLDEAGRARFERDLQVLALDQRFEAVGEAEVTDEVRVLALSGAAVLMHGWEGFEFPHVRTVLIYPDHFDADYAFDPDGEIAGMVHRQGPIVFSLRALRDGWRGADDGYNVAIHEFAHVLDMVGGEADGVPGQLAAGSWERWDEVMTEEMARVERHRSPLRSYAATNEAELFAVATEVFFERPIALRRRSPELYALLSDFFAQDPATRSHPDREDPAAPTRRELHHPPRRGRRRR